MIPHELAPRLLKLPESDGQTIVIMTCSDPRHVYFAYRLQKEFGDSVVAWYQYKQPSLKREGGSRIHYIQKIIKKVMNKKDMTPEKLKAIIVNDGIVSFVKKSLTSMYAMFMERSAKNKYLKKKSLIEKQLFSAEITRLEKYVKHEPRTVSYPNSPEFIAEIQELNPYFFLILGGPLYCNELISKVKGIAINQHAGWSPQVKGSGIFPPLYNRNLEHIGSTIHVVTSGADTGPVLRRSNAALVEWDTPESCALRTVILGTELMVEVVKDFLSDKEVFVFDQPSGIGKTYLGSSVDRDMMKTVYKDFSVGWLKKELNRMRKF
ncbi:formyltransferase family protein [Fibrobacterota bacterium]